MISQERTILYTLAYSDVFRFSLTKAELWRFLMSEKPIARDAFELSLRQLLSQKRIVSRDGLYALADHMTDIKIRKDSLPEIQKKLRLAKRAAYYLSYIPTISLIGISGSVAMGKADEDDDIDFFIITRKNTLFVTRLWIQTVLEILNLRRRRANSEVRDTICVNLLIDEARMSWPKDARDVYTAHEIVQMQPLFERDAMYERFIISNEWVRRFLPNAFEIKPRIPGDGWKRRYISLSMFSALFTSRPFELLARITQKRYMKRHQTTETIGNNILAFHPFDYRSKTLDGLNMKLRQLGLLTNN